MDGLEWKNPINFENMMKKACVLHNFTRNAPINLIFDVATALL